jgi:saccharopine dehydrogenase (NAD+, L-lysine-forming)
MRILVLGGAGAMGRVTVRDLAENSQAQEIIVGDLNIEKAEEIAKWAGNQKITVKKVDISNMGSLVEAMKEADVVANAAPYVFNMKVTRAAIKTGKPLTDLGGVYYTTLEQLKLNEEAKKADVTIVLGCGVAPGIADVLAKYGADKLDLVEAVHIRYGDKNFEPAKYKWTFQTVLEEYTKGPVIYQDGEFKKLSPFSGKHVVKFPEPVGERNCCYALYSGITTLPQTIDKGVKTIDCAMSYNEEDEVRIKVLEELGLTRTQPVKMAGTSISPKDFLLRVVPPPAVHVRDAASIIVEVLGKKADEEASYVYSLVYCYNEAYGVSAISYLTGVPLSIVAEMLAENEIKAKGVLPPEKALNPEPFFHELSKRGIKIRETLQRTRLIQKFG